MNTRNTRPCYVDMTYSNIRSRQLKSIDILTHRAHAPGMHALIQVFLPAAHCARRAQCRKADKGPRSSNIKHDAKTAA